MKSMITIAIVAFVAMTARAETPSATASGTSKTAAAASKKATTVAKKKKHKKKSKKTDGETEAASKLPAKTVGEGADIVTTGTGAGATAEKASISGEAVQTQKVNIGESGIRKALKGFSATLSQSTYGGLGNSADINTYNGTETDMGVLVGYKINDTTSVQFYNEWDRLTSYDNPGYSNRNATNTWFQDPYIGITKTGVVKNNSGFNVDTMARVFLPMSAYSIAEGQIAQIRLYGVASQELTKKLTVSLTLSPRFYIQTKDTYTDVIDSSSINKADNFRLLTDASLRYSFNDKWSVQQTLGTYQYWYRGASQLGSKAYANRLDASTSVEFTPTKAIDLEAGIRQAPFSTDLTGGSPEGLKNGLYSKGQTEYYVSTAISLE